MIRTDAVAKSFECMAGEILYRMIRVGDVARPLSLQWLDDHIQPKTEIVEHCVFGCGRSSVERT